MTDSTILIIIIAVLAVAAIVTGAFFLARHLRGKIRLNLAVTGFEPGSAIKGSFELHATAGQRCDGNWRSGLLPKGLTWSVQNVFT